MNIPVYQGKVSFRTLCIEHGMDILALAHASGRHVLVIWDMLLGHRVTWLDASLVLNGFNRIHGTHYQLEDIYIHLAAD